MKSKVVINLEYLALKSVQSLFNALSYKAALRFARALGWMAFNVFRYRRSRTLSRIRSVFPEKSEREVKAIALKSIQNLLMNAAEMMRSSKLNVEWMDEYVKDGRLYRDQLKALVDEGKGVVIMVPHSGNWYMAAWAMAKYGVKLFAIAARQRNPKLERWMNEQYGEVEVLDRDEKQTLVKIARKLKGGEAFAILPDLRVRHEDVDAEFLGGHANVSRAGAAFAVKYGSPIVVAQMRRENGKHVFNYIATLRPDPQAADKKEEAARLTREALKLLSDAIRLYPGDWFWYNKRWILEPVHKEK